MGRTQNLSVTCPTITWPTNTCNIWPKHYKQALYSCTLWISPATEVVPLIKQLLTKVTHVDLAGNYFPVVLPEQPQLQDMLKQNVSLTAPNRYLGSTDWVRQGTSKAHAYRCVCVAQQQHTIVWDYLKLQWAAGRKTVMLSEGSEQHLSFSQTDSMLSWLMRGLAAMLLQPHCRLR